MPRCAMTLALDGISLMVVTANTHAAVQHPVWTSVLICRLPSAGVCAPGLQPMAVLGLRRSNQLFGNQRQAPTEEARGKSH